MTVIEVIQKSTEFLTNKGVESPRLQTELLLAHVLKLPRMKLYLNFERPLAAGELDEIRALVKRRGQREPLQHITGTTSFCGLEMAVSGDVLVPRPETELLAEAGWEFLGKHPTSNIQHPTSNEVGAEAESRSSRREEAHSNSELGTRNSEQKSQSLLTSAATALDFGTGSGCIAIALAVKCLTVRVVAVDFSGTALTVARQNAARNGVSERIEFVCGDGFAALPTDSRFDLIVSNPPYIPTAEIESLQPEVRDFDPRAALDGGADGLDFYRRLAAESGIFLNPGGKIMLEFGDGQAGAVREIFETQMWVVEAMREDYTRRQRILVARRK